jgi:hypothetical protein
MRGVWQRGNVTEITGELNSTLPRELGAIVSIYTYYYDNGSFNLLNTTQDYGWVNTSPNYGYVENLGHVNGSYYMINLSAANESQDRLVPPSTSTWGLRHDFVTIENGFLSNYSIVRMTIWQK